jgi:hypothetical protein
MIGSFLSSWSAHTDISPGGDRAAARAEMDASRYGDDGMCVHPVCSGVVVRLLPTGHGTRRAIDSISTGLSSIGIRATFLDDVDACLDPRVHVAICVGAWIADYPDASNMIVPFLSPSGSFSPTLLGASPDDLRRWGYRRRRVASIDDDYERCAATSGVTAALCWARLDQLLTGSLAAIVPIAFGEVVRIHGADVSSYSLDQAFGEPSLDRVAVTRPQ